MLKACLYVHGVKKFRKKLVKWGSIVHLEDDLGEDVYKNQICILSTFQEIISEVLRINIDGKLFLVRIKEAFGWTPSFAWDNHKSGSERISDHGNFQEDQDFNSRCEKEESSYDLFGI